MKRELGIARCGLACCLCSENDKCTGCNSGTCPDKEWCENRKYSIEKGFEHCFDCKEECREFAKNVESEINRMNDTVSRRAGKKEVEND